MDAASGKVGNARARVGAGLAVLLALGACGRQGGANRPPEAGDAAVATINGQTVWASDVKREAVAEGLIGQGEPLDASNPLFHQALDDLIDQKLLAVEAERQHLMNDPETLRRLAAAREKILGDLLVEHLVESTVSDSAIRGLYDEELKSAQAGEELHAQQIVTTTQADADAVRKALAGGQAFETMAAQKSIDAQTRLNGGDLGWFTADVLPPPYADALKGAKPGDVVGPFRTDAGWVVMKLDERRAETPVSLDAARPQIVNFLTYEKVRDLLRQLRHDNKIKLLIGPAVPAQEAAPEPASAPTAPASAATASTAPPPAPVSAAPPSAAPASAAPAPVVRKVRPRPRPHIVISAAPPAASSVPVITAP
ncbi:MAG TPA: peptidylprolyl isomerase [Caulobacteraceae bacterium]|nr:peptidylprolyl isomerase [Caulobacteraceae bacterium]